MWNLDKNVAAITANNSWSRKTTEKALLGHQAGVRQSLELSPRCTQPLRSTHARSESLHP
eukprot:2964653-Pleurochrysis_carterae.AAC.2